MKKLFSLVFFSLVALSCNYTQDKDQVNSGGPKIVEAHGYIVPKDSMAEPRVVIIDESKLKKTQAGTPKVVLTNTNIHLVGNPKIVVAGIPRICTPGQDTFLLPKVVPAIDSPFVAGVPEVNIAKDPHINDNNPQSFSSFSKLQGLKNGIIRRMLQDKSGNLWICTLSGVSKYDGKSFTHFTDKEGLSNNSVGSILEDKSGNLWFGTDAGGVTKYDGKSFTHFTDKQGLSNNGIVSILEDKSGNLWFGKYGGVSKYDGKSFTHFTDKQGLIGNNVLSILEDKNGNLWFGTFHGVSKYDGKSFTNFTTKEGLSNNSVLTILEDKGGNLWFGTDGGGVSKYDGNRIDAIERGDNIPLSDQQDLINENGKLVKSFTHFTDKEGLSNNIVLSILEDKSGNLWFGTDGGGVNKYDGNRIDAIERGDSIPLTNQQDLNKENGKLVKSFTHFTDIEGLSNNIVYCILEDKSGNLWFGTDGGGVSKYYGKSFTHFTKKEGLRSNIIFGILEDKSGNLWFGTNGGGVSKYDGKSFTHFTDKEGLSNITVTIILEDKSGNLWFGTYGGGVSKYDGKSFTHFTKKEGLTSNSIWSILEDKNGNLWFGASGGVSKYDGKSFTNFTKKEGLSNNSVRSILEDKSGNLWFGTNGGGVSKYDGNRIDAIERGDNIPLSNQQDLKKENGKLVKSFTHFSDKEGLSNNYVWSILEDRSGNLWFGTLGGGVSMYDGNRIDEIERGDNIRLSDQQDLKKENGKLVKSFTHFTEKAGLINNSVVSILEDKSGNLWFGTRFGLARLDYNELLKIMDKVRSGKMDEEQILFKNYYYDDGFYGLGCQDICQGKNGTIWIAANDRLTALHPQGDETDTISPNIQLTSIALFNETIAWVSLSTSPSPKERGEQNVAKDTSFILGNGIRIGNVQFDAITKWYSLPENLSLAYNNNYLTFNYIGITQKSPKKVKYKYKLEGLDKNWSALTDRNEAPYGNLPQGNYTFKVKAMSSEGYWSKEFNYNFTIRPPWWKTWWAYSIYFIAIIASIRYYIKWREKSLKKRQKELEQTVTERTAEVVAEKIEVEKQKKLSDELLLNILPSEVAEELKAKGSADAKQFDDVTVMFTDFKGFTQISEKLTPAELVAEIHTCFKAFDAIITKHNIEKIKTIGDAYMCAGGLPMSNTTHASDVVKAAIEIQQFMLNHLQERKASGKELFEIRIGIHTGPVVAGIVGVKKFAYDIWGDTVNIASRMESSGEAGKVNISGSTYELVKDKFRCNHRGKIQAKNKGEVDMYFVEASSFD